MDEAGLSRTIRRAKARLVDMTVHEVSLVDRPANEQPFLVVKADMATKTKTSKNDGAEAQKEQTAPGAEAAPEPAAETSKEKLVLPAEAQQLLTDALGDCAESLAGLNMAVAEATVQEGAPVPPALAEALRSMAGKLVEVADQLAPSAPAAETAAAPPPAVEVSAAAPLTVEQVEQAMERVIERRMAAAQKAASEKGLGPTEKSSEASVAAALEARVTKALDELHVVSKAIHANAILSPLMQRRQASNVQQVEKTEPTPDSATKKVVWPADMSKAALESLQKR